MSIALAVELIIVPSEMENFLARVKKHRSIVLAEEPGCECFDILVPDELENTVLLHEVYTDDEAIKIHLETPHMKAYLADTAPMMTRRIRRRCVVSNE